MRFAEESLQGRRILGARVAHQFDGDRAVQPVSKARNTSPIPP